MPKRSLLFVSPTGSSVKTMRVSARVVVALALFAVIGIAGFFMPLDLFTLSEQEQEQKRTLEKLNAGLRSNINATLIALSSLSERLNRLQGSKQQNKEVIDLPARARRDLNFEVTIFPEVAVTRISASEDFMRDFLQAVGGAETNGRGATVFDALPLSRPVAPHLSVISRRFEVGRDPFTSRQKMHYGVDFAAEIGTPVTATASGVVSRVERTPVWGNRVTITHERNFRTVYAHLGTVAVQQGRRVARGDAVGTVGVSGGLSTGVHVHYEIWHNDRQVDPELFFFPDFYARR